MKKTALKNGKYNVTFELPAGIDAGAVAVCGDFNGWEQAATPMKQRKDGSFGATVRLDPGRYRYRYLLDGETWENDWAADAYEPNDFGSDDSIVEVG